MSKESGLLVLIVFILAGSLFAVQTAHDVFDSIKKIEIEAAKVLAGEDVGTLFLPRAEMLSSRKYWIGYTLKSKGQIVVDEGAVAALCTKKKSLLPSGILAVMGNFDMGDAVEILNADRKSVARGLAGYSSRDIERIMGKKSAEIEKILGYKYYDEVINRDDLVLL